MDGSTQFYEGCGSTWDISDSAHYMFKKINLEMSIMVVVKERYVFEDACSLWFDSLFVQRIKYVKIHTYLTLHSKKI